MCFCESTIEAEKYEHTCGQASDEMEKSAAQDESDAERQWRP